MKDRSLFHLLMARLQQLTSGLAAHERDFAESLQGSLKIEQNGDWYSVAWLWRNKQYDLNVPGDSFHFYVRGDIGKAPAIRGGRAENWKSAEALLRRIAELSGERLPEDRRPGSMNVFVFDQVEGATPHALMIVPGLAAGLVALAFATAEIALWTAVVSIALAYLNGLFRYSLLCRPAHGMAPIVIACGALIPGYFMTSPMSAAAIAVSIALFARAELLAGSLIDWVVAGVAAGAIVFAIGPAGWVAVAIIAASILLTRALMPRRLPARPALAGIAVAVTVAILAGLLAHMLPQRVAAGTPAPPWLHGFVVGMFAVTFLLGWVFGQQFLLFPWIGLGVFGATYLAVLLLSSPGGVATSLTALTGFGVCAAARLLYAFAPQPANVRR